MPLKIPFQKSHNFLGIFQPFISCLAYFIRNAVSKVKIFIFKDLILIFYGTAIFKLEKYQRNNTIFEKLRRNGFLEKEGLRLLLIV